MSPAAVIARTQPLPGWCSVEKAAALADLVLREKPTVCVEVGVFGGRSLLPVAAALRANGAGVVHAIDPWTNAAALEGEHPHEDPDWLAAVDFEVAMRACLAAVEAEGLTPFVRVRRQPSQSAAWAFDRHSIDLLHIDGNHSSLAAERDVRDWLPKVRPGGLVAFDDSHWPSVAGALALLDAAGELIRDYGTWRLYRKR